VLIPKLKPEKNKRKPLEDLESHVEAYVTIGELARHWHVSRQQIYKQIEAGTLPAIRLGPRLLRIATTDALTFERRAHMRVQVPAQSVPPKPHALKAPLRARRG